MAAVRKRYLNARSIVHDVAVGENETIRSEDKAGAATVALTRLSIARPASGLRDLNLRDRWADLFGSGDYRPGIGVEQGRVGVK